jgi:hypothetical protein
MSPAVEVSLPEWPPRQLDELRERWSAKADRFAARPDTYISPGLDGLPAERPVHPEAERWDLHFSRPEAEGLAEVTVYVKPKERPDPAFEQAVGWTPRGSLTALAWKSAADLPGGLRAALDLALDAASTFGGVVGLDAREKPTVALAGRLYEIQDEAWADAELFGHLSSQPWFEVAGYTAAEPP